MAKPGGNEAPSALLIEKRLDFSFIEFLDEDESPVVEVWTLASSEATPYITFRSLQLLLFSCSRSCHALLRRPVVVGLPVPILFCFISSVNLFEIAVVCSCKKL